MLNKTSKRSYFWSHLLFSMIAIFALPNVQGSERIEPLKNETCQQQPVYCQILHSVNQHKYVQRERYFSFNQHSEKHTVCMLCLFAAVFSFHAPIRGSPVRV